MPAMKPVIVFDGDCGFCRKWIAKWQKSAGNRVDFFSYQELADPFHGVTHAEFSRAVYFIQDQKISFGAEAVFTLLAFTNQNRAWLWMYDHVPGFVWLSETGYRWVAGHRPLVSKLTKFWK
jgi:predicted DCC family thiol-disulfide oxidoreductase YuxK